MHAHRRAGGTSGAANCTATCGGLTPSLLTWIRAAVILPSGATWAPVQMYSPGLRSARSPGTARTSGTPSGTRIFCIPSLYLRVSSRFPAAATIASTLALVIIEPGSRSQGMWPRSRLRGKVVNLASDERAVGLLLRRRADVVSLLDVLELDRLGDRHADVVGHVDLEVLAVARLHRQHVAVDRGDGAAYAHRRLLRVRGAGGERERCQRRCDPDCLHDCPPGQGRRDFPADSG